MPVGLFLLLIYGTARQSSGAARKGQPVQEKFNGAIKTAHTRAFVRAIAFAERLFFRSFDDHRF